MSVVMMIDNPNGSQEIYEKIHTAIVSGVADQEGTAEVRWAVMMAVIVMMRAGHVLVHS